MRVRGLYTPVLAIILLVTSGIRAEVMCPNGMEPTIAALEECVMHARAVGHIDNAGVANSLLSKLDAAQRAQDSARESAAISLLEAFIHAVDAQAGIHIDAMHAQHMVMHAEAVIATLSS